MFDGGVDSRAGRHGVCQTAEMTSTEVSPEFTAIVEMLRSMMLADASTTIFDRRALLEIQVDAPERTSVERVDAGGVPAEWIVAPGASTTRAVLHLHGGAFTAGGVGSHRGFASALSAAAGCAVLLVDYRLAPESPFPAALDDAVAAYGWLIGPGRGLDASAVIVSGDSAGGGLAASLLVDLRDGGTALPGGAVLLSPWTDLALSGASHSEMDGRDPMCSTATLQQSVDAYLPAGADATDPRASPLYADLAGLPPLLIHAGEVEVLRDDSVLFAGRATAAGVDVELLVAPDMVHVWHMFAGMVPESTRSLDDVATWIAAHQQ